MLYIVVPDLLYFSFQNKKPVFSGGKLFSDKMHIVCIIQMGKVSHYLCCISCFVSLLRGLLGLLRAKGLTLVVLCVHCTAKPALICGWSFLLTLVVSVVYPQPQLGLFSRSWARLFSGHLSICSKTSVTFNLRN